MDRTTSAKRHARDGAKELSGNRQTAGAHADASGVLRAAPLPTLGKPAAPRSQATLLCRGPGCHDAFEDHCLALAVVIYAQIDTRNLFTDTPDNAWPSKITLMELLDWYSSVCVCEPTGNSALAQQPTNSNLTNAARKTVFDRVALAMN